MDDRLLGLHHARVAWRVLDGETIVVDLASGASIFLNETATVVWEHLALGARPCDLVGRVCASFDVDQQRAEIEVHAILSQLDALGIVAWDVLGPAPPALQSQGTARREFAPLMLQREEAFVFMTTCGKSGPTDLGCEILARDS